MRSWVPRRGQRVLGRFRVLDEADGFEWIDGCRQGRDEASGQAVFLQWMRLPSPWPAMPERSWYTRYFHTLVDAPLRMERTLRQARLAQDLSCRVLLPVLAVERDRAGRWWIVTERDEGCEPAAGAVTPRQAVQATVALGEALEEVHARGEVVGLGRHHLLGHPGGCGGVRLLWPSLRPEDAGDLMASRLDTRTYERKLPGDLLEPQACDVRWLAARLGRWLGDSDESRRDTDDLPLRLAGWRDSGASPSAAQLLDVLRPLASPCARPPRAVSSPPLRASTEWGELVSWLEAQPCVRDRSETGPVRRPVSLLSSARVLVADVKASLVLSAAAAHHQQGSRRFAEGDTAAALRHFDRAVALDDCARHRAARAAARAEEGDLAGALDDDQSGLSLLARSEHLVQESQRSWFSSLEELAEADARGEADRPEGWDRFEEANAQAEVAFALQDRVALLQGRSVVQQRRGDHDAAVRDLDAALELLDEDDPRRALLHHGRAVSRQAQGDLLGALQDDTAAVRLAPDEARFGAGLALSRLWLAHHAAARSETSVR